MADDEQKVLYALKDAAKPMRPGEIAEATGLESKEVSKIIKYLKDTGTVCSPKRCYYAPSD